MKYLHWPDTKKIVSEDTKYLHWPDTKKIVSEVTKYPHQAAPNWPKAGSIVYIYGHLKTTILKS